MIELNHDKKKEMATAIKRYLNEEMEIEAGDLKAELLLDYFMQDLAPVIYNKAIADATKYMQERAADLEGSCFEPEFGYWNR